MHFKSSYKTWKCRKQITFWGPRHSTLLMWPLCTHPMKPLSLSCPYLCRGAPSLWDQMIVTQTSSSSASVYQELKSHSRCSSAHDLREASEETQLHWFAGICSKSYDSLGNYTPASWFEVQMSKYFASVKQCWGLLLIFLTRSDNYKKKQMVRKGNSIMPRAYSFPTHLHYKC